MYFGGICPYIWSPLSAPANTSVKFSNHNTQVGNIRKAMCNMYKSLNYSAGSIADRWKPLKLAIFSSPAFIKQFFWCICQGRFTWSLSSW